MSALSSPKGDEGEETPESHISLTLPWTMWHGHTEIPAGHVGPDKLRCLVFAALNVLSVT